jgi:hypothetical protein
MIEFMKNLSHLITSLLDGTVPYVSLTYPRVWERIGIERQKATPSFLCPKIEMIEMQVFHFSLCVFLSAEREPFFRMQNIEKCSWKRV